MRSSVRLLRSLIVDNTVVGLKVYTCSRLFFNFNIRGVVPFGSPNKRSFRGPGGVGRRLDSRSGTETVRGNWPRWPPGGLPWPPLQAIELPFRTGTDIAAQLSKYPGSFPSFAGV